MLNSKALALCSFSCATFTLLPLQALAQDADWSGAFAGAKVGLGAFESEIHDFDENAAFGYSKNDGAAASVDLQAGYNWQSGNFVYGAVLSIGATSFDESFDNPDFCSPTTHATTVNALASLRGRAGFAAGNTLFYGTAGIASIDTDETLACDDDISFDVDDRYEALVVGFGVESMIADNLSISAEYLSYIADNQEIEGFDDGEAEDEFSTFDIKADTVSIGVNYHFF